MTDVDEVEVLVPLVDAPDWLRDELVDAADAEGPEEEGKFGVYYAAGKTADQIAGVLQHALVKHGATSEYCVAVENGRV